MTTKYIFATAPGIYATDGTDAGTIFFQATDADFVPQPEALTMPLTNGRVEFFTLVNPALDLIGALTGGTVAGTSQVGTTLAPDGLGTAGDTVSKVVAIGSRVSFAFNIPGSG